MVGPLSPQIPSAWDRQVLGSVYMHISTSADRTLFRQLADVQLLVFNPSFLQRIQNANLQSDSAQIVGFQEKACYLVRFPSRIQLGCAVSDIVKPVEIEDIHKLLKSILVIYSFTFMHFIHVLLSSILYIYFLTHRTSFLLLLIQQFQLTYNISILRLNHFCFKKWDTASYVISSRCIFSVLLR